MVIFLLMLLVLLAVVSIVVVGLHGGFSRILIVVRRKSILIDL